MNFGRYLRDLRTGKDLRQSDLAEVLGVTTVYICDIEKGKRNPPDYTKLRLIDEKLNLTYDEKCKFYDLAGVARQDVAPDVAAYLIENPDAVCMLRRIMIQPSEYNWASIIKR